MAGSRRERQTRLARLEDYVMTLQVQVLELQRHPFGGSVERLVSLMQAILDLGLSGEQVAGVKGLHDQIAVLKEQVAAQQRAVDALTRLTRSLMTLAWLAVRKVGITSEEFVEAEAAFDAN